MHEWILLQEGVWVYIVTFLLLMGGAVGLPVPEDLPLIVGGILVHQGNADFALLVLVCYSAVIFGDVIIYFAGRYFGPALFKKNWFRKRMTAARISKVRFNLERRSLLAIFFARHLFYLRTVTFLVCGAVRMSFSRFLIADMIAAFISVPLMIGVGYIGAEHYEQMTRFIGRVKSLSIFLGIAVLIAGYLYWRKRKKEPSQTDTAPSEDNQQPDL